MSKTSVCQEAFYISAIFIKIFLGEYFLIFVAMFVEYFPLIFFNKTSRNYVLASKFQVIKKSKKHDVALSVYF